MSDPIFPPKASLRLAAGVEYQILTDRKSAELRDHPAKPGNKYFQLKNGINAPFILLNVRFIKDQVGGYRLASYTNADPVFEVWDLVSAILVLTPEKATEISNLIGNRFASS